MLRTLTLPREGAFREGTFEGRSRGGARARNDALRSRAALGITPCGTRTAAGGAVPGLGWERAGNARLNPRPRKHGLELSQGVIALARAAAERRKASAPRKQMSCAECVYLSAARAAPERHRQMATFVGARRGIGWMRLSALRSLFDCRGRVYFCAWSWVELGHDMSRERCRASAPAKRGRGDQPKGGGGGC